MNRLARTSEVVKVGSAEMAKVLGATAFAALFFAPHAANHALETTSVPTTVAGLPVELGYYPGATRVDGLNQATIYLDETIGGVGIDAKVTGLPRIESFRQASDLISPKHVTVYTSLADSPKEAFDGYTAQLKDATVDTATEYLIDRTLPYGLAIYGGIGMVRLRRKLQEARGESAGFELTPLYTAGAAVVALASSLAVADHANQQWENTGGSPSGLRQIEALNGTTLEGATIDNPGLEPALNAAINYGLRLKERRQSEREDFMAEAAPNLVRSLESLSAPKDRERILVFISDMHAGKAGTELATVLVETLQDQFGTDSVRHTFNLGDTLYDPGLQGNVLVDQANIMKQGSQVLTPGNHDTGDTSALAADAGMIIPNGSVAVDGVSVYSVADPEQTPFLQDSYYPDPSITQASIAEDAYVTTQTDRVDLINFHDPAAVAALVGATSRSDLTAEQSLTTCTDNDDFRDIGASMASAGHSHEQYPINMECNSDGTWFVVNLQGTGGGAEESPTFNSWSDPDGAPIKTISYRVFYQNTDYGSITGVSDIQILPDASVSPAVRTDIGTLDGAPFSLEQASGRSDAAGRSIKNPNKN